MNRIRTSSPRAFYRISLLILLVTAGSALSTADASAQSNVRRGREIVVSASAPEMDSSIGVLSVANLKLPAAARVARLSPDGSIATISIAKPGSGRVGEPIPAQRAEIARICSQIIALNPAVSMDCEANFLVRSRAVPDDPYFSDQYGLYQIHAPTAWDVSVDARDVIVAVIDTGVDHLHRELWLNVLENTAEIIGNRIDDDRNGFVDDVFGYDFVNDDGEPIDDEGHGTMCAGIIGAHGNNGVGISGVAWRASILPVKVLDNQGWGTPSDIAAGIRYATMRGAKVINISFGGYEPAPTIRNAIKAALVQDVVVVVAAGNDSNNNDVHLSYPDGYALDNIIAVAATRQDGAFANFSNYGSNTVDLAAPGRDIITTYPDRQLAITTGTSFSAPYVSGVATMIRAINPRLSFAQVKNILISSVDQHSSLRGKMVSGGRLNFGRAARIAAGSRGNIITSPRRVLADFTRRNTRLRVSGSLVDMANAGVPSIWMTLVCNNTLADRFKTGASGSFSVSMPTPPAGSQCYVADDQLVRSRVFTVR